MAIDLPSLHAAGAEVAGQNGDAWLRHSAVQHDRNGIIERVRALHAQLGRRVLVGDLTTPPRPTPIAAEVSQVAPATAPAAKPRQCRPVQRQVPSETRRVDPRSPRPRLQQPERRSEPPGAIALLIPADLAPRRIAVLRGLIQLWSRHAD